MDAAVAAVLDAEVDVIFVLKEEQRKTLKTYQWIFFFALPPTGTVHGTCPQGMVMCLCVYKRFELMLPG